MFRELLRDLLHHFFLSQYRWSSYSQIVRLFNGIETISSHQSIEKIQSRTNQKEIIILVSNNRHTWIFSINIVCLLFLNSSVSDAYIISLLIIYVLLLISSRDTFHSHKQMFSAIVIIDERFLTFFSTISISSSFSSLCVILI